MNTRINRFYHIYHQMRQRCLDINHPRYNEWGGRGIIICDDWLKFKNFEQDMYESYLNHEIIYGTKNTTLDRVDNNGNYCKENCRWATRKEQANNRRHRKGTFIIDGKHYNLRKFAEYYGFKKSTMEYRLYQLKMSEDKAIKMPFRFIGNRNNQYTKNNPRLYRSYELV